jgi:hypothetical protein
VAKEAESARTVEADTVESLSIATTDPDAKTEVGTTCSSCDTESTIKEFSPRLQSPLLDFSDFSNHLGTRMDTGADDALDDSSMAVVESSALPPRVEAESDAYGWEAELERRRFCELPHAREVSNSMGNLNDGHPRQPCLAKRSLLHRVFSMGHASHRELGVPSHRVGAEHMTASTD